MSLFLKILALFLVLALGCAKGLLEVSEADDCLLISNIINKINILDEPDWNNKALIFFIKDFPLKKYQNLNSDSITMIKRFNFDNCTYFTINNIEKVEILNYNPCDDSINNLFYDSKENCLEIYISDLIIFKNNYLISIQVKSNGFYSGTFLFKMKNNIPNDIKIVEYTPLYSGGTKDLREVYPHYTNQKKK